MSCHRIRRLLKWTAIINNRVKWRRLKSLTGCWLSRSGSNFVSRWVQWSSSCMCRGNQVTEQSQPTEKNAHSYRRADPRLSPILTLTLSSNPTFDLSTSGSLHVLGLSWTRPVSLVFTAQVAFLLEHRQTDRHNRRNWKPYPRHAIAAGEGN